jgi:wyosine [tRNA(Phe)-imidazoG37] synthetase (radical SAM superfamily)
MSELMIETRSQLVGIREPKEITIYPISIGQQKKFADKISKMLEDFSKQSENDLAITDMVNLIITLIEENVDEIAKMVVEGEVDFSEASNNQLVEFCNNIYEMNYEGSLKNIKNLVEKVKSVWM